MTNDYQKKASFFFISYRPNHISDSIGFWLKIYHSSRNHVYVFIVDIFLAVTYFKNTWCVCVYLYSTCIPSSLSQWDEFALRIQVNLPSLPSISKLAMKHTREDGFESLVTRQDIYAYEVLCPFQICSAGLKRISKYIT